MHKVKSYRPFVDLLASVLIFFGLVPVFLWLGLTPLLALIVVIPAGIFVSARRLDISPDYRKLVLMTLEKHPGMSHLRWSPFDGGKFRGSYMHVPFSISVLRLPQQNPLGGLMVIVYATPDVGAEKRRITVKHDTYDVSPSRFGYYRIMCDETSFENLPRVFDHLIK